MRRLPIIALPLLAGLALGAAHAARAEGACVYRSADVQLSAASVTYDGVEAPLDAVPAAAVLQKPPNEGFGIDEPTLVIGGARLTLEEAP